MTRALVNEIFVGLIVLTLFTTGMIIFFWMRGVELDWQFVSKCLILIALYIPLKLIAAYLNIK